MGGRPASVSGRGAAGIEQDFGASVRPGERLEGVERVRRDHRQDDALARRDQGAMAQEIIMRRGPGDHGHELLQDAVLLPERQRVGRGGVETVEADDHLDPVVSRRQRHLDLR